MAEACSNHRVQLMLGVAWLAVAAVGIARQDQGAWRQAERGRGPANPPVLFHGGKQWTPVEGPPAFALPLQLAPSSRETLLVQPAEAAVAVHRGRPLRMISLTLTRTAYDGTYLRGHDGRTEESPMTSLFCYELVPADRSSAGPYTWAMWSRSFPWAPESFWIFNLGEKGTYLLFTHIGVSDLLLPSLSLANVTYARDRISAFSEDFGGWPEPAVPLLTWELDRQALVELGILPRSAVGATPEELSRLLEEEQVRRGADPNAPFLRLEPSSVSLDANGEPVVSLRVGATGSFGRLAMQDGKWAMVDAQPAPPPESATPVPQQLAPDEQ
jgi:hypothetical protein